jgi:hypothetical protein
MTLDAKAFTAFEQAAHDRIARPYAKHFAPLTNLALEPLLDAARIAAGQRVLDVPRDPAWPPQSRIAAERTSSAWMSRQAWWRWRVRRIPALTSGWPRSRRSHVRRFKQQAQQILACLSSHLAQPPLDRAGGTIMRRRLIML